MAQLNDTMVQGDLRVTGKIYGTDNVIRLDDANLAIPTLGAGDYVGSAGDFFIGSSSGKNLPDTTHNFNIHTTVTHFTGTTYRLSQIATPTSSTNPSGIYERGGSSTDGVTWTFSSWASTTTDTLVKATAKSDIAEYKLLATASASPTSGASTEAVYSTGITMNPSTNTLTANLSGVATYAKALDPQIILNSTLYKVPVISADKEVRWSGAPGASGSTAELTYDNSDSKNLLSVNVTGYATSLEHAFAGSTVNETPIINVSGSTDGFKLTYGATTADLGITKLYTTDDANAKLSFGNMVSSTYKEALTITNGSAALTGTVNGYTIGKSVPSDAKFTDTTYTANNGVSLSGTTFSNSGVRSTTINGNYLRVNTNGTNADLTIPYATNAHRLRAAYAAYDNVTGCRLLAEIHPNTGSSANRIATFDALFTHANDVYSLAHIYVNIRTNHNQQTGTETYNYYWGYIDKRPSMSYIQIRAYKKTGSNSLFLFAYVSEASWCGVQLTLKQTSDYNGQYKDIDVVDLKQNDTRVTSLDSSYTQVTATNSYHNVLATTSQVGSATVPVYVKSNGKVDTCTVGSSNGLASLDANGVLPYNEMYKGYVVNGDAVFKLCRIPKTTTYSGGVSFVFTSRAYNKSSGQVLLWVSPGEYQDNNVVYKVVNLFSRANDVSMQFFYNEVTVDGSSYVDVYYRVYGSSNTHVMPLWMRSGVLDMLSTGAVTLPASAVEMTSRFFNVCAAKDGVGSVTSPVYASSNGELKACALPQTISFSSLGGTSQQRVIARLAYVAGDKNSVMTLMVTQGEQFGQKDSCGIYFVQASYRGTPSLRTTVINSGSSSGSHCTFAYYTGSESGTNYMYIVAKRPDYSASMTVMQIGAFETDGSIASSSKKIYDGGTVSSSGTTLVNGSEVKFQEALGTIGSGANLKYAINISGTAERASSADTADRATTVVTTAMASGASCVVPALDNNGNLVAASSPKMLYTESNNTLAVNISGTASSANTIGGYAIVVAPYAGASNTIYLY